MSDDHISLRQLLSLTFAALLSPAIQVLPGLTAQRAGEAGWLTTLVLLPAFLGLCLVLRALLKGEGVGLAAALEGAFGRWGGRLVCLLYLLWGLFLLAVNARLVALRFLTISYRNAPLPLFLLTLLGLTLWLVRKPVRVLGRVGEVFHLALSVGLILALGLGAFQMEAVHLLPLWTQDALPLLTALPPAAGVLGTAVYAAVLAGGVERPPEGRRRLLRWAALLCLALTALQMVCLGSFGPGLTARLNTPFFMMVKGIGLEGGFQRMESLVIALWVLSDLALLALLACACAVLAQRITGRGERRQAALPVVLLAAAGALWLLPDAFELEDLVEQIMLPGTLALGFGVPVLALIVKKLRRQE